MGIIYSPRIVTDGLVLCLDAANARSYPGTGTTWTDLKGDISATLTNGAEFDSANLGSITTDGTDDYIDTAYHIPQSDATIDIIFKRNEQTSVILICGQNNANATQGFGVSYQVSVPGEGDIGALNFLYGITSNYSLNQITTGVQLDKIHHLTICTDFTNSSSYKVMLNGSIITPNQTPTFTNVAWISSSESVHLGGSRVPIYYGGFNFYSYKVYNRLLSEEEMRQNYLATKGRYQ